MIDIKKLKELAHAATPGPWHAPGMGEVHAPNHDEIVSVCFSQESDDGMCGTEADADFIAAANPATVLELIALVERQEAVIARMQEVEDAHGPEMNRLQAALAFWLPSVPDEGSTITERIVHDAYLLCGIHDDMPDAKTAEELGWIALAKGVSLQAQPALTDDEPSELEAVITCLDDDAAMLHDEWPEVAENMRAAVRLLEAASDERAVMPQEMIGRIGHALFLADVLIDAVPTRAQSSENSSLAGIGEFVNGKGGAYHSIALAKKEFFSHFNLSAAQMAARASLAIRPAKAAEATPAPALELRHDMLFDVYATELKKLGYTSISAESTGLKAVADYAIWAYKHHEMQCTALPSAQSALTDAQIDSLMVHGLPGTRPSEGFRKFARAAITAAIEASERLCWYWMDRAEKAENAARASLLTNAKSPSTAAPDAPNLRNIALAMKNGIFNILNSGHLHDEAPAAKWARQASAAIDRDHVVNKILIEGLEQARACVALRQPAPAQPVAAQGEPVAWWVSATNGNCRIWFLRKEAAETWTKKYGHQLRALYESPPAPVAAPAVAEGCTQAVTDVLAERHRQITQEGWTAKRDDGYKDGELSRAAACYAYHSSAMQRVDVSLTVYAAADAPSGRWGWPWSLKWWKPKDPRRDLVRAGALLLAEIERIDRAGAPSAPVGGSHD